MGLAPKNPPASKTIAALASSNTRIALIVTPLARCAAKFAREAVLEFLFSFSEEAWRHDGGRKPSEAPTPRRRAARSAAGWRKLCRGKNHRTKGLSCRRHIY